MQTYLTNINELLLNWYAIIMNKPLYKAIFIAAIVAAVIWLCMLVYYQIKVARLRGKLRKAGSAHETERNQLNTELDTVKEQLQQTAIELDAKNVQVAQLENDRLAAKSLVDRAAGLEQKAKQLVDTLHTDFYLPALPDAQQADLAQLLSHAIHNVADRLKSASQQHLEVSQLRQQEVWLLAEKDNVINDLQNNIDAQAMQIKTLEYDFKTQKSIWQQEQAQLHQELQLAQANYQDGLAKIAQLEQNKPQFVAPTESSAATVKAAVIEPEVVAAAIQLQSAPYPEVSVDASITETVIESVMQAVAPIEEALDAVVANVTEVAAEVEAAAETTISKAGNQFSKLFGSMKGLGAAKKSAVAESAEMVEAADEEIQASVVANAVALATENETSSQLDSSQVSRFFGSLKNMGFAKKSAVEEDAKVEQESQAVDEAPSAMTKLKGLMHFKKASVTPSKEQEPAEPEALLDSMVEKLEASNINKLVPNKLKDIYRKIMSV